MRPLAPALDVYRSLAIGERNPARLKDSSRIGTTMKANHFMFPLLVLLFCVPVVSAQNFTVSQTGVFRPQNKKVLLLKDSTSQKKIILFQTKLRVNTDGSPLSYHPQDPRGRDKALNNICNAIVVKKDGSDANMCLTRFGEAISVFERFRDSNFQTVPPGFRITWQNVLATVKVNGKDVPCIFQSGDFEGFFGSLTALKNGLTSGLGECEINNQVNPMTVPALVLAGGANVVKDFGAKVGDLLVAFNPKTQLFSSAIIGDTGPRDNLGEGSVLLNMRLLGTTTPPTNKTETFRLSIEDTQVLVAIIPASRSFHESKPFTAENINQRVRDWQRESGFDTPEKFIEFLKSIQPRLR